jgi:essential nuclear protein 1
MCCLQVVDALSRHFLSFGSDPRVMPVIWHASLLIFVQRYKHQLTAADRDALMHLTSQQHHYGVSLVVHASRVCVERGMIRM